MRRLARMVAAALAAILSLTTCSGGRDPMPSPDDRHANRLARETSPYLLQHADNPVDWYPWGEEAFQKAAREDRPIFLSIGYSSCHWCHVMERESFEDAETAALLNELFVSIKVDREERPDVDAIYMSAVQAMTGRGGWPLSVFLTPERSPYFGGTYFPPERRHGMPSFREVLRAAAEAYRTRRDLVGRQTERLRRELERLARPPAAPERPGRDAIGRAVAELRSGYDPRHGGFGDAPKFPPAQTLRLLLLLHVRTGDEDALRMALGTLRGMARGGIFDHAGGGFHRYSTDARWLVPHFEKMLYDNALLAEVYLEAYQITRDDGFRRTAERTLDFLLREMTSPEGGFYTALDADSEGEEGRYYVWTAAEIRRVLGDGEFQAFRRIFDVTDRGNREGKTILAIARDPEEVAPELGAKPAELRRRMDGWLEALRRAREGRVRPARDEKILTAWNGLAITAFARAARILGERRHAEAAARAARFILDRASTPEGLLRSTKGADSRHAGVLDDYAYLARALLDLYETTFELRWLRESLRLTRGMVDRFWDAEAGGFFYAGADDRTLWLRPKRLEDGAKPAGNAVAAEVCARLAHLLEDAALRERAEKAVLAAAPLAARHPHAVASTLLVADLLDAPPVEIVIVGPEGDAADRLLHEARSRFLPWPAIVRIEPDEIPRAARMIPLLEGKAAPDGAPTAYLCRDRTCLRPVTDPDAFARDLDALVRSLRRPR